MPSPFVSDPSSFPGKRVKQVFLVRHVPAWFPGAGFQREAQRCRALLQRLMDEPFALVKKNLVRGFSQPQC